MAQSLPGKGHSSWKMDVSSEDEVDGTFASIEDKYGPVAVLICNAGILILHNGQRLPIAETSLSEWERTHAVNTRGTFLCARAYLKARIGTPTPHGRIITFSSCAAQLGGYRSSSAYISSKSAILGFTRALAREAAPLGITVNGVAPGMIDTALMRQSIAPGQEKQAAANVPLGRLGETWEIAAVVSFLVSEAASYITGTMNDVNGGYRMQ